MFTIAFPGDLRSFKGNPFKTETPFGVPVSAGLGDALDERCSLLEELKRVTDCLETFVREHSDPGTEALAALHCARAAIAKAEGR